MSFTYPTNSELRAVEQNKLPVLTLDDPIFDLFPIRNVNSHRLTWEQKDDFAGLQQARGMNGEPPRVKKTGAKSYDMEPGVYGEYELIDEKEMTTRRPYGEFNGAISIDDLVMEAQDKLLNREIDRIRYLAWQAIIAGTISVSGANGAVIHAATFTPKTYTGSAWGTPGSGTPLADFRAAQLLFRGTSNMGGPQAKAYMNQVTFNKLVANTNAADFYGRRTSGLGTANGLKAINEILLGEGLPQIVIYDETWQTEAGVPTLFIADNKTIIVGKRKNNAPVGEYRMTRNANNPNAGPGAYTFINDTLGKSAPRRIEVHKGHNGGPVLFFGGATIVMTTT